jgi:hypothetical protein
MTAALALALPRLELPTASRLHRASICPASAVLPRIEEATSRAAERGKAVHQFLATVGTLGVEPALAAIPKEWHQDCRLIDLDSLPQVDPMAWAHEVALVYNVHTGRAREVGRNLERSYPPLAPGEIAGTADVVALTPDAVVVADWKTGWSKVPGAAVNWQVRFYALAAARAYGRERAVVAIVRLDSEGHARWDSAEFDEFDMATIEQELVALVARLEAEHERVARGERPRVVYGDHCAFCPAVRACPAVGEFLVRAAGSEPAITSHAQVARWISARKAGARFIEAIDAALEVYADAHGPVKTTDGMQYGRREKQRETIIGEAANIALRDEPTEVWTAVVKEKFTASKSGVKEAAKLLAKREVVEGETSRQRARRVREHEERLMGVLRAGDAFTVSRYTVVDEHKAGEVADDGE